MKDICIKLGIDAYNLINQSAQAYSRHAMSLHAAALAYRLLFSVFPFIVFLFSLLSFFAVPAFFGWIRDQAVPFLPHAALEQVDAIIRELQVPRIGLLSASSAVSLWMASSGMRQLMIALNVVYAAVESRVVWKRIPFSMLFTVGIAMLLITAGIMMHFGPPAMQCLAHLFGIEPTFIVFWEWLRWPAALLLSNVAVALAYYVIPNVKHRFRLFFGRFIVVGNRVERRRSRIPVLHPEFLPL
ncbi:YihY/virulence factor BrkB family protein [Massilia forsythiae]|uniref:YihY/virulence factor BrkB family protein n=1 Tax=Massilia forsythiae TaxID=2728020 RepID=UPI001B7CFCAA|nr:YihY/virulence factor BrkB family protein [Massilia forsythiae]